MTNDANIDPGINTAVHSTTADAQSDPYIVPQTVAGTPSVVTDDVRDRLKHCAAYLGHRSEEERYASLLTIQAIVVQHMSAVEHIARRTIYARSLQCSVKCMAELCPRAQR